MRGWEGRNCHEEIESQIVFALKQAETGVAVAEVCRKMGISEATFYNWKKKYGGLGPDELRRLRQLEKENSRLKQITASCLWPLSLRPNIDVRGLDVRWDELAIDQIFHGDRLLKNSRFDCHVVD